MSSDSTIVVLGATGHFGGRIARRLLGEPGMKLVVTGRDASSATALAAALQSGSTDAAVTGAALDLESASFAQDLATLRPDIVIHTAGPYQGQDYRVAEACIACGSHYLDLADGREFVGEFRRLNDVAEAHDVLLVAGASTLPGLSSAVVDMLRDRFAAIHEIGISIAPAHRTPRGTGTIDAVLSYCGRPFPVLVDGVWRTMHGWQDLRRQSYPELGRRLSAACDVPDLVLLPEYIPGVRTVTFHAALEAGWEQLALWSMAGITRLRLVRDWRGLLPLFRWTNTKFASLGSDNGGMHIRLAGLDIDGSDMALEWHLTARLNHGPEIPCSPALILARKLVRADLPLRGAYPCLGLISVAEFDHEVRELDIEWSLVNTG